jgi:hypothetical protein
MGEPRKSRPAPPTAGPSAAAPLGDPAKVVAWGLVFWGAVQLAASVFARNATVAVAVQAAIAEWGAGAMGIAWSDPVAPIPTPVSILRRAALGATLGGATAALGIAAALAAGTASLAPFAPAVGPVALGLVLAALGAVRDELLVRGVVLRATRGVFTPWAALAACGAATAAARFGVDGTLTSVVAFEALRGSALGALWMRDRGAWMAWAANAAWTWTAGSLARGGVLDVRFKGESQGGLPVLLVLATAALTAAAWSMRKAPGPKAGT